MTQSYLHGFSDREQERLYEQARFLAPWVHDGLSLPSSGRLIEIGCGVGAQTEILLERHPSLEILAIDQSETQLQRARERIRSPQVRFEQADASQLSAPSGSFDAAFVCWLLEHVRTPEAILREAARVLKPGARVHLREVFNAGFWTTPESLFLKDYWERLNQFQLKIGGDPYVGARLGNLLSKAGFEKIEVRPVHFHFDRRTPEARANFLDYLRELFLSAAPGLLEAGTTTEFGIGRVRDEFERLKRHPECVIYFHYMEAQAVKV
jgi:ubiquinone/menaquinone biosynthesis C-methylase UbiE